MRVEPYIIARRYNYIDWVLKASLDEGVAPDDVLPDEAVTLLAAKLKAPLQIGQYLGSERWQPATLGRVRIGELKRALARLGASDAPLRRLVWGDGQVSKHGQARCLSSHLMGLHAGLVLVTSEADHHPNH